MRWSKKIIASAVIAENGRKEKNFPREDGKKIMKRTARSAENAYKFTEKDTQYLEELLLSKEDDITYVADVIYRSLTFLFLEQVVPKPISFVNVASRIEELKKMENSDAKDAPPFSR